MITVNKKFIALFWLGDLVGVIGNVKLEIGQFRFVLAGRALLLNLKKEDDAAPAIVSFRVSRPNMEMRTLFPILSRLFVLCPKSVYVEMERKEF